MTDTKLDYAEARKAFLSAGHSWPEPKQNRLLRAARGEEVDEIPVWIMRQAGRYLPEFKELRAEHDFVKVCQDPDLASEVTIQPYRRFNKLDACIVFSDILTIPMLMGQHLEMVPGKGPVLSPKLETPEDIERILNLKPNVGEGLAYVYDAIFATVSKLENQLTVIGFC
ncbi:uroporphyrinogen decarboxylase, putative, partial [Perkinsus marinus ATCC 50983]